MRYAYGVDAWEVHSIRVMPSTSSMSTLGAWTQRAYLGLVSPLDYTEVLRLLALNDEHFAEHVSDVEPASLSPRERPDLRTRTRGEPDELE